MDSLLHTGKLTLCPPVSRSRILGLVRLSCCLTCLAHVLVPFANELAKTRPAACDFVRVWFVSSLSCHQCVCPGVYAYTHGLAHVSRIQKFCPEKDVRKCGSSVTRCPVVFGGPALCPEGQYLVVCHPRSEFLSLIGSHHLDAPPRGLDASQMSGDGEKKYNQVYFEKDADGRPSEDGVFAVEDAKQVRATLHLLVLYRFFFRMISGA